MNSPSKGNDSNFQIKNEDSIINPTSPDRDKKFEKNKNDAVIILFNKLSI